MKGSRTPLPVIAGCVMIAALAAPAALPAADDGSQDAATASGAVVAPAPADAEQSTAASSSKQTTHEVVMKDIAFVPKQISVEVGDTITWRNEDSVDHNAIANDDSFSTENFGQGETASATIDHSGTIPYICSLHAGMKGTITAAGGTGGGGSGSGSGAGSGGSGGSGTGADSSPDDFLTDPGTSPGTGLGASPSASNGDSSLPLTGSDSVWLAIAGAWLLSVGAAIRAALSGAR